MEDHTVSELSENESPEVEIKVKEESKGNEQKPADRQKPAKKARKPRANKKQKDNLTMNADSAIKPKVEEASKEKA